MALLTELIAGMEKNSNGRYCFNHMDMTERYGFAVLCKLLDKKLAAAGCGVNSHRSDGKVYLAFELSMPQNNTWNGKWSGENKTHVVTEQIDDPFAELICDRSPYKHDFGDGWTAQINVTRVTNLRAEQLNELSDGFHGYKWMVDSIISKRRITSTTVLKSGERNDEIEML